MTDEVMNSIEKIVRSTVRFLEGAYWADLREGRIVGRVKLKKFRPVSPKVGWMVKDRLEARGFYLYRHEDAILIRRVSP